MAYRHTSSQLIRILEESDPINAALLKKTWDTCNNGLLSIGFKLHCTNAQGEFDRFADLLGGKKLIREENMYRHSAASFCLVLPPLGNAPAAIALLRAIEKCSGVQVFNNPDVRLQICSPARLDAWRSALLAIAFYLGSDTLRRYRLDDLETTASYDNVYRRGRRLVLYDAGGAFDRNFEWWRGASATVTRLRRLMSVLNGRHAHHSESCVVERVLPFSKERSDIFAGIANENDVSNINLIATLLVHAQYGKFEGVWKSRGREFEKHLLQILAEHQMIGILNAAWVCDNQKGDALDDDIFMGALKELTSYAYSEAERLDALQASESDSLERRSGILVEMKNLLAQYRTIVNEQQF